MPRWTTEARLKQAERIRALGPWKHATGPRTEAGKARSARNAWKGGVRATVARFSKILRETAVITRKVFSSFRRKRVSRPPRTWAPKPVPVKVPVWDLDSDFPSDAELDRLSTDELRMLVSQLPGGEAKWGGNLFSSFG